MINGITKVIGVIGNLIEHSFSPALFNAAFKEKKMDYVYVPFKVEKHD